jgi:hypothetical protein
MPLPTLNERAYHLSSRQRVSHCLPNLGKYRLHRWSQCEPVALSCALSGTVSRHCPPAGTTRWRTVNCLVVCRLRAIPYNPRIRHCVNGRSAITKDTSENAKFWCADPSAYVELYSKVSLAPSGGQFRRRTGPCEGKGHHLTLWAGPLSTHKTMGHATTASPRSGE